MESVINADWDCASDVSFENCSRGLLLNSIPYETNCGRPTCVVLMVRQINSYIPDVWWFYVWPIAKLLILFKCLIVLQKIYSYDGSAQMNHIKSGTSLHIVCPTHPKPEYSVFSIKELGTRNWLLLYSHDFQMKCHAQFEWCKSIFILIHIVAAGNLLQSFP